MVTEESFFEQLEEKRKTDPLIGASLGAQDFYQRLYNSLIESDNRIDMSLFLLWASGLAGMSCQMAVREHMKHEKTSPSMRLMPVDLANGTTFYVGEGINYYLFETEMPVVNFIMATYLKLSPEAELPSITEAVQVSLKNIAAEDYKVWGMENPQNLIPMYQQGWNSFEAAIRRYCANSDEWPILFALLLQKVMEEAAKVMNAKTIVDAVVENLLISAKLDFS